MDVDRATPTPFGKRVGWGRALPGRGASDFRADCRSVIVGLAGAFTVGAVAVALARSQQPFDHGWWLVAYLVLVGGLSQFILGAGQLALGAAFATVPAGQRLLAGELVLWNLGAVLVPVGVFAGAPGVVALGSAVLLAALALFAAATGIPRLRPAGARRPLLCAYWAIMIFLAGSVIVGAGLAEALPWQWA
jgi:hypothetical protein